jgi:hypothetical protein
MPDHDVQKRLRLGRSIGDANGTRRSIVWAFTGIVPIAAPRWELDILVEHPIYIAPANPNWICNAAGQ